jgi:hypothetical protein
MVYSEEIVQIPAGNTRTDLCVTTTDNAQAVQEVEAPQQSLSAEASVQKTHSDQLPSLEPPRYRTRSCLS